MLQFPFSVALHIIITSACLCMLFSTCAIFTLDVMWKYKRPTIHDNKWLYCTCYCKSATQKSYSQTTETSSSHYELCDQQLHISPMMKDNGNWEDEETAFSELSHLRMKASLCCSQCSLIQETTCSPASWQQHGEWFILYNFKCLCFEHVNCFKAQSVIQM